MVPEVGVYFNLIEYAPWREGCEINLVGFWSYLITSSYSLLMARLGFKAVAPGL